MDPELFDIERKKLFHLWPDADSISYSIIPYVKRIKKDKLALVIVNDLKGENSVDFLNNCDKIVKINVANQYDDSNPNTEAMKELFDVNTSKHKEIQKGFEIKDRDVVCIEKSACTVEKLELYYKAVKSGGIFCGNGHDTTAVKQALNTFRRNNKIGSPILISNRTTWFWYKR